MEMAYKSALESNSNDIEACNSLAWIYARSDRVDEAIELLHRAIQIAPDRADTYNNLGLAYRRNGNWEAAIQEFKTAIKIDSKCAEAWFNLAQTLEEKKDIHLAERLYRRLLKKKRGHLHGSINLGNLLCDRGDFGSAESVFMEGLSEHPDSKVLLYNLGNTKRHRGNVVEAISFYQQALLSQDEEIKNEHIYTNLGFALRMNGDMKESLEAHRRAFLLAHTDSSIRLNYAMTLFHNEDYENGWIAYESRIETGARLVCTPKGVLWDGRTRLDEIVLVAEQGIGDTIMFARYARCARDICDKVILCVPQNLVKLLSNANLADRVCGPTDEIIQTETPWLPLLSLPRFLGVSPSNPLIQTPYLEISADLVSHWSRILRYQAEQGLLVGLCWQGNPSIEKGLFQGRSAPLEVFHRLSEISRIRFVALQKGFGLEQLGNCSFRDRFICNQEIVSECWDFVDTAAMIMACDVVISTDTSVAHLSGALGQRSWLLLHQVPEWRWGREGSSTPWYSSMRIFRQEGAGDWTRPVNEAYDSLVELSEEKESGVMASYMTQTMHTLPQGTRQQRLVSIHNTSTPLREGGEILQQEDVDKHRFARIISQCAIKTDLSDEIAHLYQELLRSPGDPEVFFRLGSAFREEGDFKVAIDCYSQADALCTGNADIYLCLGLTNMKAGDLETSISWYKKCLDLRPRDVSSWCNLAMALLMQGDLASADHAYCKAIEIQDDFAVAHTNYGVSLLLEGKYREGLREFEWRWNVDGQHPIVDSSIEKWEGSLCDVLLVVGEQGLGDSVQFMRYCKYLRDRVNEVHLCLPKKLISLAELSGVADRIISTSEVVQGNYRDWIPLLSILRILDITPTNVLESGAYISIPSDLSNYWGKRIAKRGCLTVGLHWQGNPRTETGALQGRSLQLQSFKQIATIKGVQFVSLQKGFGSEQLKECSFREKFVACQDEVDEAWPILDTAAVIQNCDIVITSDSLVAHLSGGLGVTTWILLQKVPDWRWGMTGRKTHWYDSVSMYRQQCRGDWQDVIHQVAIDLEGHLGSRRS